MGMDIKEGIPIEDIKFIKSGNVYRLTIPKKIFEFLKLSIKKKYDIIIKEKKWLMKKGLSGFLNCIIASI